MIGATLRSLAVGVALAVTVHPSAAHAPAPTPRPVPLASAGRLFVHVPAEAPSRATSAPRPVIIALHGVGAEGSGFCQPFLRAADRNGWVVVAPTFAYRNWRDPAVVAEEDLALMQELATLLDSLPERVGVAVRRRAVLVGFSRGAQLAHRFALTYPERTRAVVVLSAGTYTLPRGSDAGTAGQAGLRFPFGTADLELRTGRDIEENAVASIPFLVGVGAEDARAEDVPRQWDRLLGRTRVERARAFAGALEATGVAVRLRVYDGVGHAMAPEMVRGATGFVEQVYAPAPAGQ